MKLDQALVDAAIAFVNKRFDAHSEEGAAALYTEDGEILISTGNPGSANPAASLCYETGAICEAYKLGKRIVATVCVQRDQKGFFHILTPCGICQERLFYWGADIEAAVPLESDTTKWQMKYLKEIQPYYWHKSFK